MRKLYHMHLNREVVMSYGTGTDHIRDAYWTMEEIKRYCRNANVLKGKQGITGIIVIQGLDGHSNIAQFCGYTENSGLYGYLVKEDGTLERFC